MKSLVAKKELILLVLFMMCYQASAWGNVSEDSIRTEKKVKKVHEKPWTVHRFNFKAGGFFPINNTSIRVDGARGNGTDIDLEKFGMPRHTPTFIFGFNGRFGNHHRVDFNYYRLHRHADRKLEKELDFGEHTYPVNADVYAYFNTDVYRVSYGYAFFSNKKFDVGANIGFHVLRFDLGMSTTGKTLELSYEDDFGITAPLPNFGLWGTYAISSKFAITAEVDYLAVKIGDIKGRIIATDIALQYGFLKHFNVNVGYTGLWVNVEASKKRFEGDLSWGYNGPSVAIVYHFDGF
ncbi:MAG: hypothetical protein LBV72_18315 [Tannerella sp.]|jgi:hypothetical protein|nr:hypothetical protein [Tannerella sp.]